MEKWIQIVCIISVVILILVSNTSIVGYRSVDSDVKISPLFNIRNSKAIGKESKNIICDYVGKGKTTLVTIPKRDNRIEMVQKVLEIISKADDNKFKVYLNMIINQIQKNDEYDDVNINEVMNAIHQFRGNQEGINLNANKNGNFTWSHPWGPTWCWYPGCFIIEGIDFILVMTFLLILISTFFIASLLTIAACGPSFIIMGCSFVCETVMNCPP